MEADRQHDHRRRRPLGLLAAVVLDDQQHRQLRSALLRPGNAGGHRSRDRPPRQRRPLQRHRPAGRRLRGRGQRPRRSPTIRRSRRCSAASRAASRRRTTTSFEPRLGVSYSLNEKTIVRVSAGVFHNRVTLNDSTLLGGNPPFQPHGHDLRTATSTTPAAARRRRRPAVRHHGQDLVFKHPTSYMWSAGVQREMPFGFVVDVDLRRPPRPLPAARAQHQPAAARARSRRTRASTSRRCVPYKGYGVIRLSRERRPLELQQPADQRRSPLQQWPEGRRWPTRCGKSEDNGSDKRDVLWNTYDDTGFWGPSSFDRRHVLTSTTSTTCRSGGTQNTLDAEHARRLAGLGLRPSCAAARRSRSPAATTSPASATAGSASRNLVGDPKPNTNEQLSTRPGTTRTSGSIPRRSRSRRPARSATRPATCVYNPGDQQWDIALFKNFSSRRTQACSSGPSSSTSRTTRT